MMAESNESKDKTWYLRVPDPMVIIFIILVITALLTHIIPAGEFSRIESDGITKVDPHSFTTIKQNPATLLDIFVSIPKGLVEASQYLFIVFIAGGLFHLLTITGALENAVGTLIKKIGLKNRGIVITLATFIFGFFGAAVGFENNIALIPIGVLVGHALGGGALLGAGIAIGGIGLGFALSPINPYTVGVAQNIAELNIFSGALLRTLLLITSLMLLSFYLIRKTSNHLEEKNSSTDTLSLTKPLSEYFLSKQDIIVISIFFLGMVYMLFGIFTYQWYINEIAGIFLAIAVAIGFALKINSSRFIEIMMNGAASVTSGALVIGVAAAIKVILDDARITDTLVNFLSGFLGNVPTILAAIIMTIIQGIINFFIPGGSGQALVTMPIMVPLGDIAGLTRQTTVLAFQIGDGLTNLIVPTSGGTLAMLALAKVNYADWVKFIFPLMAGIFLLSWGFLIVGIAINYS